MIVTPPWWYAQTTIKHAYNLDNIRNLTSQMTSMRRNIENMRVEWQNITALINSIFNENIELLAERDEALEMIDTLKRQLHIRTKMIKEMCEFMETEKLSSAKWEKKHANMLEEVLETKKKKKARMSTGNY